MSPRISLSEIQFRPYSHEEDITTFGPNDYTPTDGAIHLTNIKFRPWVLSDITPGSSQTGGGGDDGGGGPGPGGGGEGDATPGTRGTYAMAVSSTLGSNSVDGVYKQFAGQDAVYLYGEIYVSSAAHAAMVAPTETRFYADILLISGSGNQFDAQQGVFFTNKNASNVYTGSLYIWDYWSGASQKKVVTHSTWHTMEIGIRHVGSGNYETRWAFDGTLSSAWTAFPSGLTPAYMQNVLAGALGANSLVQQDWYMDNVLWCFDNFYSQGGTVDSGSGFETGDFSFWTGVFGTNQSVVAAP